MVCLDREWELQSARLDMYDQQNKHLKMAQKEQISKITRKLTIYVLIIILIDQQT